MFPNGSDRIDTLNGNVKKYCLEVIYAAHDGVTPMRLIAANQRGKRITKNIQGRLIDHVMILAGVNGTTVEGVNDSGGFVVIHS
jgi:hypothetical protein